LNISNEELMRIVENKFRECRIKEILETRRDFSSNFVRGLNLEMKQVNEITKKRSGGNIFINQSAVKVHF
jgi:hypothetical protein